MERINYERDYYQWTQAKVEALRERDYSSIDWDNLIEEIEDMGKSQKRAIESLLTPVSRAMRSLFSSISKRRSPILIIIYLF